MKITRNHTGTATSVPKGLLISSAAASAITLAAAAILAKLIQQQVLPESAVGWGAMIILTGSAVAASAIAAAKIKHRRILMGYLAGIAYYLLLVTVTAVFFGGIYSGMGVTACMIFCGCSIVILTQNGRAGRGKRKIKL